MFMDMAMLVESQVGRIFSGYASISCLYTDCGGWPDTATIFFRLEILFYLFLDLFFEFLCHSVTRYTSFTLNVICGSVFCEEGIQN